MKNIDLKKRSIRVFISSTFQDMQEERDVLIKDIFPQLRKMCMERGVGFTEVDLRWGVTQEQAEKGEVLPICLAEIENCRPFFIGLLGERYGWVPDAIPEGLIDEQPWLEEHRQCSVTELEIVHGVLNDPDMTDHAFFYFREPSASPAHFEDQKEQDKQNALKDRIRNSGFPVIENYPDVKTLGQSILKDLETSINKEFPEQTLTPLERDRLDHEVFAESRAKVYIGRSQYFDRLDDHAQGTGQLLVVLGESGSGKSALLANWIAHYQKKYPDTFLLTHFIGSSTDSTDTIAMLRRIMQEIKDRYNLQMDIPDKPEELRSQFPNWLSMAAAQGGLVLVLDALNQLEDKDNAAELLWLPEFIPPEVRLIVSTLPGQSLDALEKRDWPTMEVQLLEPDERQQLITEYLRELYSKSLPQAQVEYISSQEQCANPLFLHALLEELRIFGKHEQIHARIEYYLQAKNPGKLYELILDRLEQDYETDHPGLVGEALSLIWAARRGLSETELIEIMGLPRLTWSPLFLALHDSLVTRSGLLNFFHDYLRQAVQEKYIQTSEIEKNVHLRLAGYFKTNEINERKIDELPWQLEQAQEWELLKDCLSDLSFFKAAYNQNEFEIMAFWQKIEDNSDLTCTNAYQKVLKSPDQFIDVLFCLSALFNARGNLNEALQIRQAQQKHYLATGDKDGLAASIGNQAGILYTRGELDEAMKLFKESERIYRELGKKAELQTCLSGQAEILYTYGKLDEAMNLHKEAERIYRELGNKAGLQTSLGNQGDILYDRGELDDAMKLYKETERICRELGNKANLSGSLNNQALILSKIGKLEKAKKLHKEQERICLELGNKLGLSSLYGNQGRIHHDRGELDEAIKFYKKSEQICRELSNKKGLSVSLGNQANILRDLGELDDAMKLLKEAEQLCYELSNKDGLQRTRTVQAKILRSSGKLDDAMKLFKEAEQICRELGNKDGLSGSLNDQALILKDLGELEEAMNLHKESERICREIGTKFGLNATLYGQISIFYTKGEHEEVKKLSKETEQLCRELGHKNGILVSLGGQADSLISLGELDEAMKLLREGERICRELGNKDIISIFLLKQANILSDKGELDKAMKLYKEGEQFFRERGDKVGLQGVLRNRANLLYGRGELDEAIKLYKEQEQISRELNNKDEIQKSLYLQAITYNRKGLSVYEIDNFEESKFFFHKAELLFRTTGNISELAVSLHDQAEILSQKLNRHREALPLIQEAYQLAIENNLEDFIEPFEKLLNDVQLKLK
ncbi:MAG: tetratricopeptide repeat protein [Pseudomonadota bacterium]